MKANIVFVLFIAAVGYFVYSNIDIYIKTFEHLYLIFECRWDTFFGHDCYVPLK